MITLQMLTGQYVALNAAVFDSSGAAIPGQDLINSFMSSDDTVVKLVQLPTGSWQAHALQAGSVTISASNGAATDTMTINVIDSQVPATMKIGYGTVQNNPNG